MLDTSPYTPPTNTSQLCCTTINKHVRIPKLYRVSSAFRDVSQLITSAVYVPPSARLARRRPRITSSLFHHPASRLLPPLVNRIRPRSHYTYVNLLLRPPLSKGVSRLLLLRLNTLMSTNGSLSIVGYQTHRIVSAKLTQQYSTSTTT